MNNNYSYDNKSPQVLKTEEINRLIFEKCFTEASEIIFSDLLGNEPISYTEKNVRIGQLIELITKDGRFIQDGIDICRMVLADETLDIQNRDIRTGQLVKLLSLSGNNDYRKEAILISKEYLNNILEPKTRDAITYSLIEILCRGDEAERIDAINIVKEDLASRQLSIKVKNQRVSKLINLLCNTSNETRKELDAAAEHYLNDNEITMFTKKYINKMIFFAQYKKPFSVYKATEEFTPVSKKHYDEIIDMLTTLDSTDTQKVVERLLHLLPQKDHYTARKETIELLKECLKDEALSVSSRNYLTFYLVESFIPGQKLEREEAISITSKTLNTRYGELTPAYKSKFVLKAIHLLYKNHNKKSYRRLLDLVDRYYYDNNLTESVKEHIHKIVSDINSQINIDEPVKTIPAALDITFNSSDDTNKKDPVTELFTQLEQGKVIDTQLKELLVSVNDYRTQALALYKKSKNSTLKARDITPELKEQLPASLLSVLRMGNSMQATVKKAGEFKEFLKRTAPIAVPNQINNTEILV